MVYSVFTVIMLHMYIISTIDIETVNTTEIVHCGYWNNMDAKTWNPNMSVRDNTGIRDGTF